MGKIRVKALGIDEVEKQQKKEAKQKAKEKKLVKGAKGGERIVAVGPSEEELARLESISNVIASEAKQSQTEKIAASPPSVDMNVAPRNDKVKKIKARIRSGKYQAVAKMVDKTKAYSLKEALNLLPKLHLANFDETVELHMNTIDKGITATATLPYGIGKKVRVAIADDAIIDAVSKGKINFDVLLAEPSMMPELGRVAKYLGPRGLMPNPKNGTISSNPKELAKKFEAGQTTFKTEAKSPIMHLTVGKLSFGEKKLLENIEAAINAIKPQNIKNVTLKSTMSPGIKVKLD